jgi:hypothetical protein
LNAIGTTTPLSSLPPPVAQPTWRQWAFLHAALPVLLSLPQGFTVHGPGFSLPVSVLWWAATWLVAWTMNEILSRVAAAGLRPWRPPLWIVLLIGALTAGLLSRWWTVPLFELFTFVEEPPLAEAYRNAPRDLSDPEYVARLLQALFSGCVAWVVANYVFERFTRVPRFADSTAPRAWLAGDAPGRVAAANVEDAAAGSDVATPGGVQAASAPSTPATAPRFLQRMTKYPGTRLDQVHAVEAEDHYIKVHTDAGAELVYYRFTDAIDDLRPHDGLQVHRSFWVRRAAVERVDTSGRQWELVLPRGLRVPVSRANQGAIRLAGLVR